MIVIYCVYKFVGYDNEILYIGKTSTDITYRMIQHFLNGHLESGVYKKVHKIYYSNCLNRDDMSIKERYLINKLNPKYNKEYNNNHSFNFEISDFKWIEFDLNTIKSKKNKTRKKQGIINTTDDDINDFTDFYGYRNIKHNCYTPRYYSYKVPIKEHPHFYTEEKIYYYIIDDEIYIYLNSFNYSGLEADYRKKLINKCNLSKLDFITLIDTAVNSADKRKIMIKLDSAIKGVELDINSYQIHSRYSRNNIKTLTHIKNFKKYIKYKKIA